MKKILQNRRGETIVEVVVSFMLLLMFTAMFVVSLRYARAMSRKAETLRETAYAFCAGSTRQGGLDRAGRRNPEKRACASVLTSLPLTECSCKAWKHRPK